MYSICGNCGKEGEYYYNHNFVGQSCESFGFCTDCDAIQLPKLHQWENQNDDLTNYCKLCETTITLPQISNDAIERMPDLSPDIHTIMGVNFTEQFDQEVDKFLLSLLQIYENHSPGQNTLETSNAYALTKKEYGYLLDTIEEAVAEEKISKNHWRVVSLTESKFTRDLSIAQTLVSTFRPHDETCRPNTKQDYIKYCLSAQQGFAEYINSLSQYFYNCNLITE